MPEPSAQTIHAPTVFTVPAHRSFADALVAGLIGRFGRDPVALASGRILLPNNRAVRTLTEAFVRASGGGLVLPRLIAIGDPELEERIGGALDPLQEDAGTPPAIDPQVRLFALAKLLDAPTPAESLRLAADLARTLDALLVNEVDPRRLAEAAADAPELAIHWQISLDRLRAIIDLWPARLAEFGRVDGVERRNLLLRGLAKRWESRPPSGFTIAAGITTAAPAVAALLHRVARMPDGMVVLPALSLATIMPDAEWDALGPDDRGRSEQTHPQYHLKELLDRIGVARGEVRPWPSAGRASSPAARSRVVANAMTAADFSDKWNGLPPAHRRLGGVKVAELADPAAEAQAIALAMREALEVPGRTAALVTPDRTLARRVSALLARWGIDADDSAGRALSETPVGSLLLGIAAVATEELAPVPLLALLKHPLVGGEGDARRAWLDKVRLLDLALRGPRPAAMLDGLERHIELKEKERGCRGCLQAWRELKPAVEQLLGWFADTLPVEAFIARLVDAADKLTDGRAWAGPAGRQAADLLADLDDGQGLILGASDAQPVLRQILDQQSVRPPYGGHPRLFIFGLLEARLQQADLMILGGLNEGVWPAPPAPDAWLAPKIRANLGLPTLEYRIGLSAHDFASALGAPQVLITRSRRDSKAPTVASRFWLRLQAMTGGLLHDVRLERLARGLDDMGQPRPVDRPAPVPTSEQRPRRISVTSVDRLKADPFAFYAQEILRVRRLDPVDADHSAAWRGTAVHKVLEDWLREDDCTPDRLEARARALLEDATIHPMLRALWQPRLMEAIRWIGELEAENRSKGRRPLVAEAKGEAKLGEVIVYGKADRIDRLADGTLAIVDYKTGQPPRQAAVDAGFALQLGLLGLIARANGFGAVHGKPSAHEYWSLTKDRDKFGKLACPDAKLGADDFLDHARRHFDDAVARWLSGQEPFTAKLHPAFAPYGDYDQLMRLEEWYGRR
ncbi:double-strand break repair protein AddB [Sphingomonas piscis]|uniref:Double-strand break repair protein AddB n=1 Tax=Sphingomonas piscis TaxID=2714943 RepID=A0A6G7YSI8_9SPHN|nr:double-strand break repair protein AddB [Sphingomonas piscis]QIK79707.1 double-strand break repair protein AddB [Sphingomonas piscis]